MSFNKGQSMDFLLGLVLVANSTSIPKLRADVRIDDPVPIENSKAGSSGVDFNFSDLDINNALTEVLEDDFADGYVSESGPIDIGGYIKQEIGYSYQHSDFKLSKVLASLNLRTDIDLRENWTVKMDFLASYDAAYNLEGRNDFSRDTLDEYESDFRLNEFYTDIDITPWMNLRLGRQYFSWGTSDSFQISDIGNPRNYREMGLQHVEDSRLPVGATKATFYGASWEYNIIAIHEIRPHEMGAEGSEYDPFLGSRGERTVIMDPDKPDSDISNTEYLTRLYISRPWGDISFFWGETFDDFSVLNIESVDIDTQQVVYRPVYEQMRSYGLFGNIVSGSWLFKYDIARHTGKAVGHSADSLRRQIQSNTDHLTAWERANVYQWMAGVEYSGISETTLSLEYYNEVIENHKTTFMDDESVRETSLYLSRDFMNDRVSLSFWWNHQLGESTDMFRIDFNYSYNDRLKYSFAISGIESSNRNNYFYDYRKTDRITFGIKYSF